MCIRDSLYAVHRSGGYLTPPSLAARIYLLLLRWLARDFEGVYQMCASIVKGSHSKESTRCARAPTYEHSY